MSSHLKDRLFHGVKKHVRDSVRYLYSNPQTTYSELMVTARRAERETEETKVKVRSAAATEVPSGLKELGDQIASLMAALTRAEQSSHSASAPSSPRHRGHGRGQTDRNTSVHPNSHNGRTGLGQTSTHSPLWPKLVPNPHIREIKTCRSVNRWYTGCLAVLQVSGLGPYGPRVCNTCHAIKQGRGDPRECSQTPLKSCAVNSKHSLCNPEPKLTQDETARKRGWKEIAPIPFLNPNLVA